MDQIATFAGSIPHYYDQGLGPVLFETYAEMMAQRAAASPVAKMLEIAAGTGIATRRLRYALPASATLGCVDKPVSLLA